ncbi:hypothetical protein F7Q90_08005 [Pantoea stewartii subsp. stewartii]|nr:hypothetical protein F7Q90_08005 [Pantoea stewartii subsp. stewartii]
MKGSACRSLRPAKPNPLSATRKSLYAVGVATTRRKPQSGRISASAGREGRLGACSLYPEAILPTATPEPLVTTPINQQLQFRPFGPGGGGWSVGAMGYQVRLRSLPGGALRVQDCAGAVYSE